MGLFSERISIEHTFLFYLCVLYIVHLYTKNNQRMFTDDLILRADLGTRTYNWENLANLVLCITLQFTQIEKPRLLSYLDKTSRMSIKNLRHVVMALFGF